MVNKRKNNKNYDDDKKITERAVSISTKAEMRHQSHYALKSC